MAAAVAAADDFSFYAGKVNSSLTPSQRMIMDTADETVRLADDSSSYFFSSPIASKRKVAPEPQSLRQAKKPADENNGRGGGGVVDGSLDWKRGDLALFGAPPPPGVGGDPMQLEKAMDKMTFGASEASTSAPTKPSAPRGVKIKAAESYLRANGVAPEAFPGTVRNNRAAKAPERNVFAVDDAGVTPDKPIPLAKTAAATASARRASTPAPALRHAATGTAPAPEDSRLVERIRAALAHSRGLVRLGEGISAAAATQQKQQQQQQQQQQSSQQLEETLRRIKAMERERMLELFRRALAPLMHELEATRRCVRCDKHYMELDNIGRMECYYHPGRSNYNKNACRYEFSCCGATSAPHTLRSEFGNAIKGCVACDHSYRDEDTANGAIPVTKVPIVLLPALGTYADCIISTEIFGPGRELESTATVMRALRRGSEAVRIYRQIREASENMGLASFKPLYRDPADTITDSINQTRFHARSERMKNGASASLMEVI